MNYPYCIKCGGQDWQKLESRSDRCVTIDTYKCLNCERRNPMGQPHKMTWAYTMPETSIEERTRPWPL